MNVLVSRGSVLNELSLVRDEILNTIDADDHSDSMYGLTQGILV